jgi:3-oxoacyl-[acyl-carrier-protein] synthase III
MPFGKDIFVNASKFMIHEVECILKRNQLSLEDISYIIPHQANSRIISNIVGNLGLQDGKMIVNMEETGNTGCASTVIAFSQNWDSYRKDELIIITVFGGGYSSGGMLMKK